MALTKEDLQQIQLLLNPILQRLDKVDQRLDKLDERLDIVEFTVENLTKDVNKIKKQEGL